MKIILLRGFYNEQGFHHAGSCVDVNEKQAEFMLTKNLAKLPTDFAEAASELEEVLDAENEEEKNQIEVSTEANVDPKSEEEPEVEVHAEHEAETENEGEQEIQETQVLEAETSSKTSRKK